MRYLKLTVVAAVMAAGIASANAAQVNSIAALSPNDSLLWSQLGPTFTVLTGPQNVTSVGGLNGVVNSSGGQLERLDQNNGWNGNFAPGEALIWNLDSNGDITVAFAHPVFGVGAQFQADIFGAFTAQITLSNGDIFTENGVSNSNADNSAIFLGALDGTADINSITFDEVGTTNGFAIGRLYLNTAGSTNVPEPLTLSLFGAGLVGVAALRRRKKKIV